MTWRIVAACGLIALYGVGVAADVEPWMLGLLFVAVTCWNARGGRS